MKSQDNTVSWVVVLMAASSLLTMICLFQIDKIIHNDLYNYGLHFSLQWATPYWNMARIGFAMGWLNIIAAIAVQMYSVAFRRKEVEQLVTDVEKEMHKHETARGERVEEKKSQELKPTQSTEKPKDTSAPATKPETPEKKEEEKPTTTQDNLTQRESEPEQSEKSEDRKEPEPTIEQKETKPEPPEKNEESPILPGIPEEEVPPITEKTPQQTTPSAS